MKFSAPILALALVNGASAFMAPKPQGISTQLMSTNPQTGTTASVGTSGPGAVTSTYANNSDMQFAKNIWDTSSPVTVQGGSLRTWSFPSPSIEMVQVLLKTEGRPLNANVELWQGPDNTPQKMGIYIEDGSLRPFSAVVAAPRGSNSIAIRNTAMMEFPLSACVEADSIDSIGNGLASITKRLDENSIPKTIQGGAIQTYPFSSSVESVQILLKTDGRPLNARIELLQGPNNNKQVMEIYTEDGLERPFFAVVETPGTGNVVRIVNTATVEFPLSAAVEPFMVEPGYDASTQSTPNYNESTNNFFFLDRP